MITQLIELMRALDYVRGSPFLTAEQKVAVAKELSGSMPPKALCNNAQRTFEIAAGLFDTYATANTAEAARENPAPSEVRPARNPSNHAVPGKTQAANGRPEKVLRGQSR